MPKGKIIWPEIISAEILDQNAHQDDETVKANIQTLQTQIDHLEHQMMGDAMMGQHGPTDDIRFRARFMASVRPIEIAERRDMIAFLYRLLDARKEHAAPTPQPQEMPAQ